MQLILNWNVRSTNFINKDEKSKTSKLRLGHKPISLSQRTVLTIQRKRIDLKWKKEVESLLINAGSAIRKDMSCKAYINGGLYILNARNAKDFSNRLGNIMLRVQSLATKTFK